MATQFCIEAETGVSLHGGRPMVFYRVWRGRKPPSPWRLLLGHYPRPIFTSADIDKARAWIDAYHQSELDAAAFNKRGS